MSLATRCPHCSTIFRVVQDQLKVSNGLVRCGQCHEVFDGVQALFDLDSAQGLFDQRPVAPAPAAGPPPPPASSPAPVPRFDFSLDFDDGDGNGTANEPGAGSMQFARAPLAASPPDDEPLDFIVAESDDDGDGDDPPDARADAADAGASTPGPSAWPSSTNAPRFARDAASSASRWPNTRISDTAWPQTTLLGGPSTIAAPPGADGAGGDGWPTLPGAAVDSEIGDPADDGPRPATVEDWPPRRKRGRKAALTGLGAADAPRFVRDAHRQAHWSRPHMRVLLGASAVALAGLAVAQVAWPLRDTIAVRWPATAPALAWLCARAGCTIEAPRGLASLALDGSSLARTETDQVLLFSADLHNRADHAVRMPAFDLRFTDFTGQVVARKVFEPGQLGITQTALAAEAEMHVRVRLRIDAPEVSGFQAEVFYP